MDKSINFTGVGYHRLVSELLRAGYSSVNYEEVDPKAQHLILRHDIDMSLDAAIRIAEIESELGVKACYFVLLRSELYNPMSKVGKEIINRILDLGHEVGLHFDSTLYENDIVSMENGAIWECNVLEQILGQSIKVISFHRPYSHFLGLERLIAGRIHVYHPKYYSDIGYCSDSRGGWHYGDPLNHSSFQNKLALQLLTHPIWWNQEKELDPVEVLDNFRETKDANTARIISANCDPYRVVRGDTPPPFRRHGR